MDHALGRLQQFDERSRAFSLASILPASGDLRSKTWGVPGEKLNQGWEGACVGFGWTHELIAYPMSNLGLTADFARALYKSAQKIDPWPGEDYEGTSVLAGVKVAQSMGYFEGYRWAFTIDDIAKAVAWNGPVVVGTDWLEGMDDPRPSGVLTVEGSVRGGHCYVITGITLSPRLSGEPSIPMFRIRNSWGSGWGRLGDAFIPVEDFERVLMPGGEAVQPVGRKKLPIPAATVRPRAAVTTRLVDWTNVRGWRVA